MAATCSIPFPQNVFRDRFNSAKRHYCLTQQRFYSPSRVLCSVSRDGHPEVVKENSSHVNQIKNVACGILAVWAVSTASPVVAANQRLPPLSTEANRCERAFVGNTIGQANGVYDKPLDLRFCDFTNDKSNLKGKTLSAALMSDAKFDGADMSEVVMSKAYAVGASFKGNTTIPS
uniref:Thylakoid lumenal 17.4 kDa protein, chloroplastic n=1 Tax=Cannabis sativa TaxID=3483 RepID=A0A803PMP0_CANSA